eukprot:2117292-Amphidinium_carterae.1
MSKNGMIIWNGCAQDPLSMFGLLLMFTTDTLSPWEPAQAILNAIDGPRLFDAVPLVKRVLLDKNPSNSMGKSAHGYGKDAYQQLYNLMVAAKTESATVQADSL